MIEDANENHGNSGNDSSLEAPEVHEVDLSAVPGFHVLQGRLHLGTYESREAAQAFIDQQLKPQNLEAEILEVE